MNKSNKNINEEINRIKSLFTEERMYGNLIKEEEDGVGSSISGGVVAGTTGGKNVTGCIKGDCKNGQGTYTYESGRKYVGEYKDGKYNGQGTYTYANGAKYVGEYKDGKKNGQGTYTYASGSKYVGEFKDGDFNGQGTFTNVDGSIRHSGLWKDDEPVLTDKSNTDDSDGADEVEVFKDKGGKYHYTIIERNGGIEYWYSTDGENWKQQTRWKGVDAIKERINSDKVDSLGYVEMSSMGGIDPDLFIGVTTIEKDKDEVDSEEKAIERITPKPVKTIDTDIGDDVVANFGTGNPEEVVDDESDVTFKGCKKRLTGYIKLANDGTSMKDAFGDKVEEKTKDIQGCLGKYYNKFEKIGFMKKGKGVYLLKKLWDIDYERNIDGGIEGQKYEIIVNNRSRGKVKRIGKNEYRVISKPNETIFGRDKNFRDGFEEAVFNSLDLPSEKNDLIVAGIIQKGPIQWAKLLRKDV